MNIRFVGGFLSSYALTGDPIFKDKAKYVADLLLPAFKTSSGIPRRLVRLMLSNSSSDFCDEKRGLSEYGTLHLEFCYLSDVTGDPIYREKVENIRSILQKLTKPNGLYPIQIDNTNGQFLES